MSVDARRSDLRTTIAAHIGAAIALRRAPDARAPWDAKVWDIVDLHHDRDATYVLAREHHDTPVPQVPLSTRERAVAARAARGLSNKEIAYELGISVSTVAGHLAKAASKLGVATRVDLIKAVVRSRLGA
jgi:DNA-binding NarL/FixJ family response regulator